MATTPGGSTQFSDPHVSGPAEVETLRVRTLPPIWRGLLVGATALTIFLCINQQFVLRFGDQLSGRSDVACCMM